MARGPSGRAQAAPSSSRLLFAALGARRRRSRAAGDFGRDILADHYKAEHGSAAPGRE